MMILLHGGEVDNENHEKAKDEAPGEACQVDVHWSWTNCEPETITVINDAIIAMMRTPTMTMMRKRVRKIIITIVIITW